MYPFVGVLAISLSFRCVAKDIALEHPWFAQCEGIQKAHRSQKRNLHLGGNLER